MSYIAVALLAFAISGMAQRPSGTPLCDYYAAALWGENTPANQYTLLNLIVNRFAFGNYEFPQGTSNAGTRITGFLTPGYFKGEPVNLLPYFNGGLASTNQGGSNGVSVNILNLDASGLYPKPETTTPNGTNVNQNRHLQHVYPYFGQVLGCSKIGEVGYPAYVGPASIYEVHKFMYLDAMEVGYFIEQIGLSCSSFGFSDADVTEAVTTFNQKFNHRCHPPEVIVHHQGYQNNSICQAPSCPLAENAICPTNQPGEPMYVNQTVSFGQGARLCNSSNCYGQGDEVLTNGSFAGDGGIASGPTNTSSYLTTDASASASPLTFTSQATKAVEVMMGATMIALAFAALALAL